MPRLLDLFSGAGGAAMGYHRAGFEVVGVDRNPQPNYPFEFEGPADPEPAQHRLRLGGIERFAGVRADDSSALPELNHPVKLCGSAFGLLVRRHRYFESNVGMLSTICAHRQQGRPIGIYGDHPQDDSEYRRPDGTRRGHKAVDVDHAREAMGIEWMTWLELAQAIPPAYTEFLGEQLIDHLLQVA